MLRVMPALESYMIANVATQNLMGGNPFQVILGDLNAQAGSGALSQIMGPQPGVLTLKELISGEYNYLSLPGPAGTMSPTAGAGQYIPSAASIRTSTASPLEVITDNFTSNIGNIIVGTTLTTAGFRVANKVLRKPKAKMNKLLRDVGLGSTVQL
jgi:hypothetical protein